MKKVLFSNFKEGGLPGERLSHQEYMEQKRHFNHFFQEELEQRGELSIAGVALIGRIDHWNDGENGGKLIDARNPKEMDLIKSIGQIGPVEMDALEVGYDKKGQLELRGWHDHGCHKMNVYLLTADELEGYAPDFSINGYYSTDELEMIQLDFEPLNVIDCLAFKKYYGEPSLMKSKQLKTEFELGR
ncbi:hypothetical protein [Siminovitchia sp. 179-K 8D1 HS]|uniref:hypothetical protein n=1 Tax=Siminovitchia sp. 179-K 8D1 HS TaxID=3142385 RepID=UPI0039A2E778